MVAAFLQDDEWTSERGDESTVGLLGLGGDAEVAERIELVGVDTE